MRLPYPALVDKPRNVLLEPALRAKAERRAAERGLSLSAYISELIHDDDYASEVTGDVSRLINILGTDLAPTDIARDKHEMIRQAFAETAN